MVVLVRWLLRSMSGPEPKLGLGELEADRRGLWTTKEVAAFLLVSRSWVYHQAEGGLIPTCGLVRCFGTIRRLPFCEVAERGESHDAEPAPSGTMMAARWSSKTMASSGARTRLTGTPGTAIRFAC